MMARALVLAMAGVIIPAVVAGQGQGMVRVELSTPTIVFDQPGVGHFDAGWIEHPGVLVSVTSRPANRTWGLSVSAPSGTLGNGKPVSDLQWSLSGAPGDWHSMSVGDAPVVQGAGDQDVLVLFRLLLTWASDGPGAYTTDIDFTALRI